MAELQRAGRPVVRDKFFSPPLKMEQTLHGDWLGLGPSFVCPGLFWAPALSQLAAALNELKHMFLQRC
jgi:hypothetical protein